MNKEFKNHYVLASKIVLVALIVVLLAVTTFLVVGCNIQQSECEHALVIVEGVEPSCTHSGSAQYYFCNKCGVTFADEHATVKIDSLESWQQSGGAGHIAALGHDMTSDGTGFAPTCTQPGRTSGEYCTRCNHVEGGIEIPATGHNLVEDAAIDPTCSMDGREEGKHCTACDYKVVGKTLPATGKHRFDHDSICIYCGMVNLDTVAQRMQSEGFVQVDTNTVYFGMYPMTLVTDKVLLGELGNFSSSTWQSFGYVKRGFDEYMYYFDKEVAGVNYRGVYFNSYRLTSPNDDDNADFSWQDDNGYVRRNEYWFKYEPIKWTIIEQKGGFATMVADLIIDNQEFSLIDPSVNDYQYSSIRTWLIEEFYNTAFNDFQKTFIQTQQLESTEDTVWLLSENDLSDNIINTKKHGTDYALCQGLRVDEYNYSCWWLRSTPQTSSAAKKVYFDGDIAFDILGRNLGIVPGIKICLGHKFADTIACHDRACQTCGYVSVATTQHTYEDDVTCHDRNCLVCGELNSASTEHTYANDYACIERTCVDCGFILEASQAHQFDNNYACLNKTCQVCGLMLEHTIEHDYNKAHECRDQFCNICGTLIKAQNPHTYISDYTCQNRTCIVCGYVCLATTIHKFADAYTCHDRTCINCRQLVKATKSHTLPDDYTCHDRQCAECKDVVKATTEHDLLDDLTCHDRVCQVCSDTVLATTDHKYVDDFTCHDTTAEQTKDLRLLRRTNYTALVCPRL